MALLGDCSYQFFRDLQEVLTEYVLLQMCGLTDPAFSTTKGKKVENLTINNLLETVRWSPSAQAEFQRKVARLNDITNPIRSARNKIIAHADAETALGSRNLGSFGKGEDQEFFEILNEVVSAMHQELNGGPYEIKVPASGPVADLIFKLRKINRDNV